MKEIENKSLSIPRTPWAFFVYVSKAYKKPMLFSVLIVILASGLSTGTNYIFKLIVDAVEQGDVEKALLWGLAFPAVLLVVQMLYRLSFFVGSYWVIGSVKTSIDSLHSYLASHSHKYFVNRFAGSIVSKIRNVVHAVDTTIPDFLWAHLNMFVSFVITFILIATVDFYAASLFILLVFLIVLMNSKLAPKKAVLSKAYSEANTKLQGRAVDVYSNVSVVRQYVQQAYELDELKNLSASYKDKALASWFYTEKLLIANVLLVFVFSSGMFWLLVDRWSQNEISSGDFILVLSLMFNISYSLLFIGRAYNATARAVGELREGLEDILVDYDIEDIENAKPLVVNKAEIIWQNVDFKFENNSVFNNFNLNIPAGQRLGLVGSSGAGKSTFASLLLRQHDIDNGKILIDGQNISAITQDSLRKAIAIVPQEPVLFHRTIRENIAYGKPDATLEEIVEVAKKAHAHEFIEKLENGYDTLVGERGVKLSGGQKQRVAIARAMIKNAPILILDEATSALDSESEVLIQDALHKLMENKTVIAIAHRLSTLREMDRIIVLEAGKIVEDGNHESLKNNQGVYSKLWSHQSGGFLGDD